jgi:hypothetical protein
VRIEASRASLHAEAREAQQALKESTSRGSSAHRRRLDQARREGYMYATSDDEDEQGMAAAEEDDELINGADRPWPSETPPKSLRSASPCDDAIDEMPPPPPLNNRSSSARRSPATVGGRGSPMAWERHISLFEHPSGSVGEGAGGRVGRGGGEGGAVQPRMTAAQWEARERAAAAAGYGQYQMAATLLQPSHVEGTFEQCVDELSVAAASAFAAGGGTFVPLSSQSVNVWALNEKVSADLGKQWVGSGHVRPHSADMALPSVVSRVHQPAGRPQSAAESSHHAAVKRAPPSVSSTARAFSPEKRSSSTDSTAARDHRSVASPVGGMFLRARSLQPRGRRRPRRSQQQRASSAAARAPAPSSAVTRAAKIRAHYSRQP